MCNTFQYSSFPVCMRSYVPVAQWTPEDGGGAPTTEGKRGLICIRIHPVECGSAVSSSTGCTAGFRLRKRLSSALGENVLLGPADFLFDVRARTRKRLDSLLRNRRTGDDERASDVSSDGRWLANGVTDSFSPTEIHRRTIAFQWNFRLRILQSSKQTFSLPSTRTL